MAVYLIGSNGLKKIGDESLMVYPNAIYGYGYSSSPDRVLVTDVLGVSGDRVTFYRYPYTSETKQQEHIKMFRSIAHVGTKNLLEQNQRYTKSIPRMPEWMSLEILHLTAVLNNERGLESFRDDLEQVGIRVRYLGKGDGWGVFEKHYPHSISGSYDTGEGVVLESFDFNRKTALELKRVIENHQLEDFQWVDLIPYH